MGRCKRICRMCGTLYLSMKEFLDLDFDEVKQNGHPIEAATQAPNVLEEYFTRHELVKLDGEPRIIIRQ